MNVRAALLFSAVACAACGGRVVLRGEGITGQVDRDYAYADAELANPERGLFAAVELVDARDDFSHVRRRGMTIALARVQLDAWRYGLLPNELLTSLDAGFARVRAAGIKVIVRFAYNSGDGQPDAPLDWVISHIAQLAPLLVRNADVIAVVHAGFIGQWGEWHGSTHGLETPWARRAVVERLLAALPADRMVQIRTPMFKQEIFGAPLAERDAFNASWIARVGHHNDCLLASENDWGTYAEPIERWKRWVADEGRFTPVGGDACRLDPPRTDCKQALAELARLHWSMLNGVYLRDLLDAWEAQGCLGEIRRRLGYRFALESASFPAAVTAGGELPVWLRIRNHGWASPFNPRPVELVMDCGGQVEHLPLPADPRRWQAGQVAVIEARVRVPADLPVGTCTLALGFPDAAPTLAQRADYAIRLANRGIWDAVRGDNVLTRDLRISASRPRPRGR